MSFIHRFYADHTWESGGADKITEAVFGDPKPTIDRRFQEQTWTLLTKHPSIFVGRDRLFNRLPLSDIEATYAIDPERVRVYACKKLGSTESADDSAEARLVRETPAVVEDLVVKDGMIPLTSGVALHELAANNSAPDEFGFPRRQQPTLQYRNGQTSITDALKAANPSDFKPSAGDLVAVEMGKGQHVVEVFQEDSPEENDDYCAACGDPGELLCCDGCPNAFHGTCLEPPIDTENLPDLPDDQWYCPQCEIDDGHSITFETSRHSTISAANPPSSPHAKSTKSKGQTKLRGRPRKYLPGTEHFWRAQFSNVQALFASRPPTFDATLVQALERELPTPADAADVSQTWIDRTLAVLNRSTHGLYISPKGNARHSSGNRRALGQIMILRSARLREVDFSDHHEVSAVRFLSSSAAHTFTSLRYYPHMITSGGPLKSTLANFPKRGRPATTRQTPVHQKGPKLGIFYDDAYQHTSRSSLVPVPATWRRQSVSTIGSPISVDDVDSRSLTGSPEPVSARSSDIFHSQVNPLLESSIPSSARPLVNELPPPMKTRAASKRQAPVEDAFTTASTGTSQNIAKRTNPRVKPGDHSKVTLEQGQSRKRQLPGFDDGDAAPTKRAKNKSSGPPPAPNRQQLILEIIERCGGVIPDSALLLRKAVTAAWHRLGAAGVPDKRTVDANLKALCTAGKIKKSSFSFKDQRGFMVISSILTKPDIGPLDPVMRQLQKKIIELYPNHYIPSGMCTDETNQVEGNRGPQLGIRLHSRNENFERPDAVTQISPALQPIENESSGASKTVERPSGKKRITRQSSKTVNADQDRDVNFLLREERPLVFDVRVPSSLPQSLKDPVEKENKVIWRKGPRSQPMPRSLQEILQDATRKRDSVSRLTDVDPAFGQFESEVDSVARWEERSFNRFQEKNESKSWNFISHFVGQNFEAVRTDDVPIHFDGLTWYDKWGRETLYTPAALKHLWTTVSDTQHTLPNTVTPPMLPQQLNTSRTAIPQDIHESDTSLRAAKSRNTPKKRKRKPAKVKPSKTKQAKRKSRKNRKTEAEPAYMTKPDGTVVDVSGYINAPIKRSRGTQHLRNMSEAAIYRLTVAIVVIRTLSGGLDKHIDWNIVTQVFPDEDPDFIRDRWRTIRTKFRRDVAALTENLQDRFCSAYVEGEVPDLDFDDIYNNDWEGIVEWAVQSLDKAHVNGIEDLPDTREELADTKIVAFEEHRGMRDYLGYNVGSSLPVREAAQASIVFAKAVESGGLQPPAFSSEAHEEGEEQLSVAKSWALATVLTTEGNFDAHACKKKLSKLAKTSRASDALFDRALKSLITEKVVFRDREASTGAFGRGYNASKLFYDAFDTRRTVQATLLRQAARYKRDILDPLFYAKQQVVFQPTSAEDGDMVAILNLLANDRVRVQIGPDVPKNRYGLLTSDGTGTYQTRHLEKDKLGFTVLIEAVEGKYIYGDPPEVQVVPVPAIAEYDATPIPVWVDIHGNFQDELWELVICAVVGLISTRPGIDAKELVKTLSPSLTLWETEIVLQWMQRSGFVEASGGGRGQGWETTEFWWLICGGLGGWQVGNLS